MNKFWYKFWIILRTHSLKCHVQCWHLGLGSVQLIQYRKNIYASVIQISNGSDNGLPPIRRQAIIWTSAELLSIEPLGTKFIDNLTEMQNFSFTKMHMKISFAKGWPFCPGEDELTSWHIIKNSFVLQNKEHLVPLKVINQDTRTLHDTITMHKTQPRICWCRRFQ